MKNKEFYKLLNINKSNSGFTLTELLVGLVMSIFVIGALGFGLMTVLRSSQSEGSKTSARSETGRALDFISDEMRRAQAIEVDMSNGHIFDNSDAVAPAYKNKLPTGGTVRLALQIPGVSQRVIYSVAPPAANSPWKGPLVIYRWGPELTANGSYSTTGTKSVSNPANWTNEALIDKIDDTLQSLDCDGDGTNETYKGFFACVVDNDGDKDAAGNLIIEDATDVNGDGTINSDDTGAIDKNGDSVINNEDGADVDGKSITAQLYFTGKTITVSGLSSSSYSADTQTVARARLAPENNSEDLTSYSWSIEGLGGEYNCTSGTPWDMQTDFNNSTDPNNKTTWIQTLDNYKQPQPIEIDSTQPLKITSTPINATGCNSSQDPVEHEIDFGNPKTFNGNCEPDPSTPGSSCSSLGDEPKVKGSLDEAVQFFKKGSTIPLYGGHDGQPSLGKFLYDKGLAILKDPTKDYTSAILDDPDTEFIIPTAEELALRTNLPTGKAIKILGNDQRIIGFEVGQKYSDNSNPDPTTGLTTPSPNNKNPGFDLQDNIFIVTSGVFQKKFKPNCFGGSGCPSL